MGLLTEHLPRPSTANTLFAFGALLVAGNVAEAIGDRYRARAPTVCDAKDSCGKDTARSTESVANSDSVTSLSGSGENPSLEPPAAEEYCSLYLAPSFIQNAGFGIFTTKAFKGGSSVLPVDTPAIIVTDMKFHQPDADKPAWGHYDYFWEPWSESKVEAIEASTVVMTLGSMANSHLYLRNIQPSGENEYNDAVLDRGKDPGAGAFSYHGVFNFAATRDIEVGKEIYASYVKTWFEERGYGLLDESNVIKADTVLNIMKQENRGLIGKDSGQVAVIN